MLVRISGACAKSDHLATGGPTKLCKHAKRCYLRYYNVSRDKTPHFFRALAASCVLYNRKEHSQGFSICNIECSGMLRNLPKCSMGLVLSMVLKPNVFFSLLYSLLRLTDFITGWFEFDLSINKLII